MIGERISHYRILRLLGGGGMGVVYEAEDLVLERRVAIKFLPEHLVEKTAARERFEREARSASKLSHPNICTIHELGQEGGLPFIVMELMEGRTLKHLVEEAPMPAERIVRIGLAVAQALQAAHGEGIVHRDIKPANIFLTDRGDAKVLDFGLAMITERGMLDGQAPLADSSLRTEIAPTEPLTSPGTMIGTVAYMSPEQVRGEELDERTDLFSLGLVLFELATGVHPFAGRTSGVVFHKILTEVPGDVAASNPEVPPELARIIAKALEKDPELRYQSAKELVADLERLRRDASSGSIPVPVPPPAGAAAERRPPLLAALAVVATLGLASAAVWWTLTREELKETPSVAVLPLFDRSREGDKRYFADGLTEELINVLSQVPGLDVVGRTSSFQFRAEDRDLEEIGKRLGVTSLLVGGVDNTGDRVRIRVELSSLDDVVLWSEDYDRDLDDVFTVQADIARSVARALQVELLGAEGLELHPRGRDGAAYDLVLKGKYLSDRNSREELETAVRYYEQALELDRRYALAWALLGEARVRQASLGFLTVEEGFEGARRAAERALGLDDSLAEGWALEAQVASNYDWRWEDAARAAQRALELAPGDVHILPGIAQVLRSVGDVGESVALSRRAVDLDPLAVGNHQALTTNLYFAGRLEEAEAAGRRVLELAPRRPAARYRLGLILLARGRPEEALAEF
ncbi:MAG: protein kinase, partial [Thermoanaerobaculia bacterium]|nr:protein kinase [Thermoanaerobaculia bacterium]